ncbi:MAG: general secretion pathway protein GspB [Aestuariibacter sp.]
MAKTISISELQPGMVILGIVEQNGPVKIRKSGLVTSTEMVQGLAEMGVLSLNIDPNQTVELETSVPAPVSQTQFVLNANTEKPKLDADSHLSEQFNRSLFLPSLQRVPSAWQYYSSKVAIACCVILGGFAIGWLGGSYPIWLPNDSNRVEALNQAPDSPTKEIEATASAQEVAPKEVIESDAATATSSTAEVSDSPAAETQQVAPDTNNSEESQQPLTLGYVPEEETSDAAMTETKLSSQGGDISPELLERFEQAMADLEKESAADNDLPEDEPEPVSYSRIENILRVDQLPARVMARLPSLSFSAHMFASNPRDRWVKVNDMELGEGDWISDDLMIDRIEPQHVIMVFQGHQFSMRALADW